jgi:hypothetical protein
MANIVRGCEIWEALAKDLNGIIKSSGQIQIDNHHIWNTWLHEFQNEDWEDMISMAQAAIKEMPSCAQTFHKNKLYEAQDALNNERDLRDRVLDRKEHKGKAWAAMMALREVYNNIEGIDCPNR